MNEQDRQAYTELWRMASTVPHRALGPVVSTFRNALADDPDRAARTLVYVVQNGRIRDIQDAAVIALMQTGYADYREAGRAMLLGSRVYPIHPEGDWGFQPFRIFRILKYLRSPWVVTESGTLAGEVERFYTEDAAVAGMPRIARRILAGRDRAWRPTAGQTDADLIRNAHLSVMVDPDHNKISRLRRKIAFDYLFTLQGDPNWWYAVDLLNGPAIRHLYKDKSNTPNGFRPPEWVRDAIFHGIYPEGTKRAALRQVADPNVSTPVKLRLVQEHRLDDRILSSVLDNSASSWIIRVSAMTPRQAVNARSALETSGVLNMPEVMEVYLNKISQATSSVGALDRESAKGQDEQVTAQLKKTREKAAKADPIEGDVGMLVDRSGSMARAIQEAAPIAAQIAAAARDRVMLSFFDTSAVVADTTGKGLDEIERLTSRIRPGGATSMEAGWVGLQNKGFTPNKMVIVTDEGENNGNLGLRLQRDAWTGHIVIVYVPSRLYNEERALSANLQAAGYAYDMIEVPDEHDPFVGEQVVAFLGGPPARSIADKIAETEIPRIV
jgi:hypothetical protein